VELCSIRLLGFKSVSVLERVVLGIDRKFLVAVVLLAVLAVAFGVFGTVAPPLAEGTSPISPQQELSPDSVGHFTNPPTYDSGWVNVTTKTGRYFTLKHNLNTTNVVVDITGKQSLDPNGGAPTWNKTYGGTSDDRANPVVQTGDGGYALAGSTLSFGAGGRDAYLVKTDSLGNMEWNLTYGGPSDDYAYSLVQSSDGEYALAGETWSFGAGAGDFWLVKTDSAGTMQWNKTYGGTNIESAESVVQTSDGGYALAGNTWSFGAGGPTDFWLVKTDALGNMMWNKTYGAANQEVVYSLVQSEDGGYALAGYTVSYGDRNYWLVKTDPAGTMLWNKTYGGTGIEEAHSVVQSGDGEYAVAGWTTSYGAGNYDFWLVKVKPEMNLEHQRNLGNENGLAWTSMTNITITLYRGTTDPYWNYVRVRIWLIKEPSWIYGDINMDGVVDARDLYILIRNYGKTFSLLSLCGIVAVAGVQTYKTRKRTKETDK